MSSLLPLFVGLQTGSNTIGRDGTVATPLGQGSHEHGTLSSQAFSQDFSQVLREYEETAGVVEHLQTFVSTRTQPDTTSQALLKRSSLNLETLVGPDATQKTLSPSQADRMPLLSNVLVRPTADSNVLLDSTPTNESVPEGVQSIPFEPRSSPEGLPSVAITPLGADHTSVRLLFQGRGFQATSGASAIDANFSGKAQSQVLEAGMVPQQGSLTKVSEPGLIAQPVPQGATVKPASFVLNQEDASVTHTVAQPVKDVPSELPQAGRVVHEDESLTFPKLQRLSTSPSGSQNLRSYRIQPEAAVQPEGPAKFTESALPTQSSIHRIPSRPSVVNEVSSPVHEIRTTVSTDLLGEPGLLSKGERTQTIIDASVKSVGLESSSGQGLGSGMNHSPNSQSGFQQPSSFPGQGMGLRSLEERNPEFPVPTLQRLQMDVQLSENQRVSIDVGVQNRHVYAGLVMDHSVLRNLATQFVPQLENQLAQVDMELEEFSAEVREEREHDADALLHDSPHPPKTMNHSQDELRVPENRMNQGSERGFHFVV